MGEGDSLQLTARADLFIFSLSLLPLFSHTPSSYLLFSVSFLVSLFRFFSSFPFSPSHPFHHPPHPHSHHAFLCFSLGPRHRSPHRPARRCSCPHGQSRCLPQRCPLLLCHLEVQPPSSSQTTNAPSLHTATTRDQYSTLIYPHPGHTRKRRSRMKEPFSPLLTRLSFAHFTLGRVQSLSANGIFLLLFTLLSSIFCDSAIHVRCIFLSIAKQPFTSQCGVSPSNSSHRDTEQEDKRQTEKRRKMKKKGDGLCWTMTLMSFLSWD